MKKRMKFFGRGLVLLLVTGMLMAACGQTDSGDGAVDSVQSTASAKPENGSGSGSGSGTTSESGTQGGGDADVKQQESGGEISGDEQTKESEPPSEDTEQEKESASEGQEAGETDQDTKQDPYAYYDRLDELYQMQQNSIRAWNWDIEKNYWFEFPIKMRLTGDKLYLPPNYLSIAGYDFFEEHGVRGWSYRTYMVCYDRNSKEFTSALNYVNPLDGDLITLEYCGTFAVRYATRHLGYDTDGYYFLISYQDYNYKGGTLLLYCDYEGNESRILELDDFYLEFSSSFGLQKDSWVLCIKDDYQKTIRVFYEDGRMETPILENAVREAAHGLTEEVKVECMWFDTNYAYGRAFIPNANGYEYYYCDLASADPLKWVQIDEAQYESDLAREQEEEKKRQAESKFKFNVSADLASYGRPGERGYVIGETKEVICAYHEEDMESSGIYYFGGKEHLVLHDGSWYRMQIPGDGSKIDFSKYQPLSRETATGGISPIDDTYYLIKDQYGLFLRKYETGEDWEESIVIFKK